MRQLFVLLLIPGVLSAQAGRIAFEQFTLPNGLRIIYSEDHSTPVVSVDVWYEVGSRNERPGRSGFAHLFEHMMFQGSAHIKKAEHNKLIERAGGDFNGSTAEDRTNYWETVPSNRLNLALWAEADRMRSLAITEENFENQRQAVKEERRLRVDNQPYQAAFTDGLVWPFDSTSCFPYAHTVIGSLADLDAAKLPDVQAFFDTYYSPNNATLVVVGDFVPSQLRSLVNQYFAGAPLDSIRVNGITPAELEKAKNALRAGFIANRETTLAKAEELHHYLTFHRSIDEINTDLDHLLAVTSDDVKRVANTYLAPGNLTLVIVRAGAAPSSGGGQ